MSRTPRLRRSVSTVIAVLRRLPATLPGPQPQHVTPPHQVDPDHRVERLVGDLTVTDLDIAGVDEHRRVCRLQRSCAPRLHLLDDLVGDAKQGVPADTGPAHLGEVPAYLPVVRPFAYTEIVTASTSDGRR